MSLAKMARVAAAPVMTPQVVIVDQDVLGRADLHDSMGDELSTTPGEPSPEPAGPGPTAPPPAAPARATVKEAKSSVNTALSSIATFIPSEALALYMALLGLVIGTTSERQYGVKWILFVLGLAVVAFAIFDGYMVAKRAHKDDPTKPAADVQRFLKVAAFAVVSFTIYAMAVPDSPFEQVAEATGFKLNIVGGILALLAAFTLPRIATWVGVPAEDAEVS